MAREPNSVERARSLRQQPVPAEALLWRALRNRKLGGFKFRRQHPIGSFFVDFACVECNVVVEVDGESHLSRQAEDDNRSRFLEGEGWLVLRFWNTEVYEEMETIREAIYRVCATIRDTGAPPSPLPLSPRRASLR